MKKKVRHILGPDLPRIPQHRPGDFLSRNEAEHALLSAGLGEQLLKFLRLPARVATGYRGLEFFDILSEQPFPGTPDDDPKYCSEKGLPAPTWVKQRYVSLEGGNITFIDVPRKIFVQENLGDQEILVRRINQAIFEAR